MGLTKTEIFSSEQNQIAAFAKALGHPARIAILEILVRRNSCVCGEIVEVVGLAQATVSQHLKALKEAGLIKGEVAGKRTCYCIDSDSFNILRNQLNGLFTSVSNCC